MDPISLLHARPKAWLATSSNDDSIVRDSKLTTPSQVERVPRFRA